MLEVDARVLCSSKLDLLPAKKSHVQALYQEDSCGREVDLTKRSFRACLTAWMSAKVSSLPPLSRVTQEEPSQ